MMKTTFRILLLGILGLALLLQACSPAGGPTNRPATGAEKLPVAMPVSSEAVQEVTASQQNQTTFASLDGLVWDDLNRDGFQDLSEKGLRNVTVNLFTSGGMLVGTTTTNGSGAYHFKDLAPGDYFVTVILPAGFVFSPRDQAQNELVDSDTDPATAGAAAVTLAAGDNGLVFTTGAFSPTAPVRGNPGTVQPPPAKRQICAPGVYPLGGISILRVNQLAADYCLLAFLWRPAFAIGRIPDDAGKILSDVTFLEVYKQGVFTYAYDVQGQTDSIQICYAEQLESQAQIYFFDFYGAKFGQRTKQPAWELLATTITNGVACAVAQTSGAYALIGK